MSEVDVFEDLNRLVLEGAVSEPALEAITRIDMPRLREALAQGKDVSAGMGGVDRRVLTTSEIMRISMLAGQLTDGMRIDDDERLTGIIESLTADAQLSIENVAKIVGVDQEALTSILSEVQSVAPDVKYAVAVRCSYLLNAVNLARG